MATHRVIEKTAGTGERSGSLGHLGFRVWMQYQLSADDYGVCPAEAVKLQGDNPALAREPQKRIQGEIENLVVVRLCGVFLDGSRRYLYQADWQTYQRIQHPSKTAYPPIPSELISKCCEKTQKLFSDNHPKIIGSFLPHANAYADANATADATAMQRERFDRFWAAYPRKVGKDAAWIIWLRVKPSDEVTATMIAAIHEQIQSPQWLKDGGQFIPHPRTWLTQGRWQDEPVTLPAQRRQALTEVGRDYHRDRQARLDAQAVVKP